MCVLKDYCAITVQGVIELFWLVILYLNESQKTEDIFQQYLLKSYMYIFICVITLLPFRGL